MLQEERYEKILLLLKEKRHITVELVHKAFPISASTVRRDFRELVERNLARRSRGGISLLTGVKENGKNIPFDLRRVTHTKEKEKLGAAAASLLQPYQTIFIDGGTTTLQLARFLPKIPLTIITNSIPHVMMMIEHHRDNPNLEIYTAGGYVYVSWNVNLGPQARYCLAQYHADYAFMSARGINKEGVYNHNEMVVEIERVMIDNADRVVFMMDHSKIGERSMSFICGNNDIDILITSKNDDKKSFLDFFRESGIEVMEVEI